VQRIVARPLCAKVLFPVVELPARYMVIPEPEVIVMLAVELLKILVTNPEESTVPLTVIDAFVDIQRPASLDVS
jgi:hypothetical protein